MRNLDINIVLSEYLPVLALGSNLIDFGSHFPYWFSNHITAYIYDELTFVIQKVLIILIIT